MDKVDHCMDIIGPAWAEVPFGAAGGLRMANISAGVVSPNIAGSRSQERSTEPGLVNRAA